MTAFTLGFIGVGKMGKAILQGVLAQGLLAPEEVIITTAHQESALAIQETYGVAVATSAKDVCQQASCVLLAVKPQQFDQLDWANIQVPPTTLIISVMVGQDIAKIREVLGTDQVVRVMPNTPAAIGQGISAMAFAPAVAGAEQSFAQGVFAAVGEVVVIDEAMMDAVGALSGCGPAYVYLIMEALADGAVSIGVPRAMAYKLAAQTMRGAAEMVLTTGEHPGKLKDDVTSPGGTTIQGILALEEAGVRAACAQAVVRAFTKTKELGEK